MKACRMLLFEALATVVTLFAGASAKAGDDDAKLLQGKWRVVSAKQNGLSFPKDRIGKMFVVVEKDELRVNIEGSTSEQAAKFALDAKQNPKHIDFTKETLDSKWAEQLSSKLFRPYKWTVDGSVPADGRVEGVYKLEDDKLTLCWRTAQTLSANMPLATVRPSKFESALYYHQFLFVLERVKPEK